MGSISDLAGRALSNSDFTQIVSNVANKVVEAEKELESDNEWEKFCEIRSVNNFKEVTEVGIGQWDSLKKVKEGEEYKYGSNVEKSEKYKVESYGRIFALTRQAIINDDLGLFISSLRKASRLAMRLINELAFEVLTGNPVMADDNTLFHARHKNLASSGGALNTESYHAAILAMGKQKDPNNKKSLNIRPTNGYCTSCFAGSFGVFL